MRQHQVERTQGMDSMTGDHLRRRLRIFYAPTRDLRIGGWRFAIGPEWSLQWWFDRWREVDLAHARLGPVYCIAHRASKEKAWTKPGP